MRRFIVAVIACVVLLTAPLGAAVVGDAVKKIPLKFKFKYYRCVLPRQLDCPPIGMEEEKKTKCSACLEWETRYVDEEVAPTIDAKKYVYEQDSARTAHHFVGDLNRSVASLEGAQQVKYDGTFSEVIQNPERFGLIQLDPGQPTDALLMTKKMGGAAICDSCRKLAAGTKIDFGDYALFHVSNSSGGQIARSEVEDVLGTANIHTFAPLSTLRAEGGASKPAVYWNVRAQKPGPEAPSPILTAGDSYQVVFTLEHLLRNAKFGGALDGMNILAWIRKWYLNQPETDETFVNVILLTDDHIQIQGSAVKHEKLNLKAIRQWLENTTQPAEPFLRASFDVLASKKGSVPMTVAIWDDQGRPLDDFRTAAICVGACSATTPLMPASMGLDSVRAAATSATPPDLALQLLQVGDTVQGMLHRRDKDACPGGYCVWQVADSLTGYRTKMKTATDDFAAAITGDERMTAAIKVRDALFPREAGNAARDAREALNAFLKSGITVSRRAADARSIFVRSFGVSNGAMPAVPIGLYPLRDTSTPEELDYAGFYFRIEYPLEIQNYEVPATCLDNWVFALAKSGKPELEHAHEWIEQNVFAEWKDRSYKEYPTFLGEFQKWAFDEKDTREAVLYILSHRGDSPSRLVMTLDKDAFKPNDFRRVSTKPSVAILNACGSLTLPGAEDFLGTLNHGNVAAIIATKHEVPHEMAAEFTGCFAKQLMAAPVHPDPKTFNLSYAFFNAIDCLREKTRYEATNVAKDLPGEAHWNARALAYSLVGNGGLMVCAPGRKVADASRP